MIVCGLWMLFLFGSASSGYVETVTAIGCESCKLHLTCRHLSSIIAIWAADFVADTNDTLGAVEPFPRFHPRQALNQRCSGVNHCSFIMTEDCPGAVAWGAGTLTVKYACISEDRIKTFCNSDIVLPGEDEARLTAGFIHNPGYPRFYASERGCRWRITAALQQRIKITVMDISVTADRIHFPDMCSDHLEIIDSGQLIETTCQPQEPPMEILTKSNVVELVLASSHSLTPLRGVLIHYTAVGCPTPPAPEDGYLVYRNETAAEYRCCVGFVFPDIGIRRRMLRCLGASWDVATPLPDCQRINSLPFEENKVAPKSIMASEIIAPALLIVALFLINFVVLFYIYKKKQQHAIVYDDEELGTLKDATQIK